MSAFKHTENRSWSFGALDQLQSFLGDEDFDGDVAQEQSVIEGRRRELRDGKYRVVFLGEFNVGKTTLVNAFLGDEYLPTILEECTTKVTHVLKGEQMQMIIRPFEEITDDEIQALQNFLGISGIDAEVTRSVSNSEVLVTYTGQVARELHMTLMALVTVYSEEDFPQLRTLRSKFDELIIQLPNDHLEDDVALVDSPGVHSISETNKKVTHDIIPNCHLVICMLDSQNAGNEHNRDFIARILQERHRKIFFLINKADQLNPVEIDLSGHRGPAKDLRRSLAGIVDDPELFFVSGLYAMLSGQLSQNKITLSDLDNNNKVKIPFAVRQRMEEAENPTEEAAKYLAEQSNFAELQRRLLQYLYTENREGAVVASVCRYVSETAWRFARPLDVRLELAKNVPKLDKLRLDREQLQSVIERNIQCAVRIADEFEAMASGGDLYGEHYEGFENIVSRRLNRNVIEQEVLKPMRQWLASKENLSKAKRNRYQPVQKQLESHLDAFIARTLEELNQEILRVDSVIQQRVAQILGEVEPITADALKAGRSTNLVMQAGMGGSYCLYTFIGAVLGGVAGGIAGEALLSNVNFSELAGNLLRNPAFTLPALPHLNAVICAAAGVAAGAILGLLARSFGGDDARREKLTAAIATKVDAALMQDLKGEIQKGISLRQESLTKEIERLFNGVNGGLEEQIAVIAEEEGRILQAQKEIIDRLQPKIDALAELAQNARCIVENMFGSSACV